MLFELFREKPPAARSSFLSSYLQDFGYPEVSLEEILQPHEHSEGFYYTAKNTQNSLFIKITPRVPRELSNQQYVLKQHFDCILPVCFGTSYKEGILITPALCEPNFLTERYEQFLQGSVSLNDFLSLEFKVIDQLRCLHSLIAGEKAKYPNYEMFMKNVWQRLCQQMGRHHSLLNKPLYLIESNELLPSVNEMVEHFLTLSRALPSSKGALIHGEFSHTNVGQGAHKLVIYDWEKLTKNGDPCWDLAKWIKYFHYFYFVEKARRDNRVIGSLEINQTITLRNLPKNSFKAATSDVILEYFAQQSRTELAEVKKRVYLGLFLSNIFSLRKTIMYFPHTLPVMLRSVMEAFNYLK
ncbi:hypothetical protein PHSC3_000383 [Chlamydiales bacterium STE3]|nr:hypothetical protein PHSC3_000383 [Chlamydiales bacterium STE3]